MRRDVWITGIGLVSSLGEGPEAHWQALAESDPAPVIDTTTIPPYPIHPLAKIELDKQIPRRADQRQMEGWQRLGTYAAGVALSDAGIAGKPEILTHTHAVIAADGGERDVAADSAILEAIGGAEGAEALLNQRLGTDLRPTLFLAQLPNLLAGNISIVHNVTGSSRTFMGEEVAGVSAVEVAWRRIAAGQGDIFLVGGAALAGRKDNTLSYSLGGVMWAREFAPLWRRLTMGGGAVFGSMGAFLVLEAPEHARARGRVPYARMESVHSAMSARTAGGIAKGVRGLFDAAVPTGERVNVISAATGPADVTREEREALTGLIAAGRVATVRGMATMTGAAISAMFPAAVGLAALAVKHGRFYRPFETDEIETRPAAPSGRVVATSVGLTRGEGIGVVTAVS